MARRRYSITRKGVDWWKDPCELSTLERGWPQNGELSRDVAHSAARRVRDVALAWIFRRNESYDGPLAWESLEG